MQLLSDLVGSSCEPVNAYRGHTYTFEWTCRAVWLASYGEFGTHPRCLIVHEGTGECVDKSPNELLWMPEDFLPTAK